MGKGLTSKKGFTLIESIVAMGICAILMASVALVLPNVIRVMDRANTMAERNTLLNNVANIITSDLADVAVPVSEETLGQKDVLSVFTGGEQVTYTIDEKGVLMRSVGEGESVPVLPERFYGKSKVSFVCERVNDSQGGDQMMAYQLTVTIYSTYDSGTIRRSYVVKPLVLNQFLEDT